MPKVHREICNEFYRGGWLRLPNGTFQSGYSVARCAGIRQVMIGKQPVKNLFINDVKIGPALGLYNDKPTILIWGHTLTLTNAHIKELVNKNSTKIGADTISFSGKDGILNSIVVKGIYTSSEYINVDRAKAFLESFLAPEDFPFSNTVN